jgi:hypothetical protein
VGRVVKHRWYHVRLLHDFLDGTILVEEIVANLVLPVTEILTIEDHKLYDTFLHVAFWSQSLLRRTSDLTGYDTN